MKNNPPSLAEFLRAHPGVTLIDQLTGETVSGPQKDCIPCTVESTEKAMVEPWVGVSNGILVALIPAITRSEANESKWTAKMRRKLSAKKAVRDTVGPHLSLLLPYAEAYHAGKGLRLYFVRLGGRKLDRMANLGPSLKVIEDCFAGAMLADDGDLRWRSECSQEPGGRVGVRVEISIFQ